jgi:nitrogen permease regulator 2-like protein
MYRGTPLLSRLFKETALQKECVEFVASGPTQPYIRNVLQIFCSLLQGSSLKSICVRFSPHTKNIDERKLITFGLLHKLIRCLKKYPIYTGNHKDGAKVPSSLRSLFTGALCVDKICCITNLDLPQVEQAIESDPDVTVVWK